MNNHSLIAPIARACALFTVFALPIGAPAAVPLAPPVPETPLAGSSFLIIALDDMDLARPAKPGGATAPLFPTSEGGTKPSIAPLSPGVPSITPARGTARPWWQSLAAHTPWRVAKNEPPLTATPEPRLQIKPDPGDSAIIKDPPVVPKPPDSGFSSLTQPRTMRALALAVPLRRALIKAGSGDVLDTGFNGAPVLRAIGNRRLSRRTIEALQDAVAAIMTTGKVAPDDANLKQAALNASRIGQALGYRGVIAVGILPRSLAPAGTVARSTVGATCALLVVDAYRETAEPVVFDETGVDDSALNEAAAATGRAIVEKNWRAWPNFTNEDKRQLSNAYLTRAKDAMARGESENATDLLNQSVAMDSNQADAFLLLGEMQLTTDASAAANDLRRAADLNPRDGKVWGKVAIAYTRGNAPDWPRALETARRALKLGYESAELQLAMAVAQWGRAAIFSRHERTDLARDAEAEARSHLDRALFIAPQDDPAVTRGIASQLVAQGRNKEAVQILDRMSKLYPDDVQIQTLMATALVGLTNQEEEAFVAWAKVWKLSHQPQVSVDVARYMTLTEGFDRRIASVGKEAARLTSGVMAGGVAREQALLQISRLKEDAALAQETIKVMLAPSKTMNSSHTSRIFAADLLMQAMGFHNQFLETGDDAFYNRAMDMHRQAIVTLNLIRTSR